MAGRGVHFSLSELEVAALRDLETDARAEHLFETIEPDYFENHEDRVMESDKAWDAIHRALTNGLLEWEGGNYPLTHVILGGENIGDDEILLILKTSQQVLDVAAALPAITKAAFRARYDAIDTATYETPLEDDDFDYTWENFEDVRTFWLYAAAEGRQVLFTVDI